MGQKINEESISTAVFANLAPDPSESYLQGVNDAVDAVVKHLRSVGIIAPASLPDMSTWTSDAIDAEMRRAFTYNAQCDFDAISAVALIGLRTLAKEMFPTATRILLVDSDQGPGYWPREVELEGRTLEELDFDDEYQQKIDTFCDDQGRDFATELRYTNQPGVHRGRPGSGTDLIVDVNV